jgi:hypothetical protein
MTAIQSGSKSASRRALLAGALGGLGAWAASAIGRAAPVEAAAGDPIRMGQLNRAGGTSTELHTNAAGPGFKVEQVGDGPAIRASGKFPLWAQARDEEFGVAVIAGGGAAGISASGSVYGVAAFGSIGVHGRAYPRKGTGVFGSADTGRGVSGVTKEGKAVHGRADRHRGWAGYFDGKVFTRRYVELAEVVNPRNPRADRARLFLRDNGSGKTELCVRFHTGPVQVIATEP